VVGIIDSFSGGIASLNAPANVWQPPGLRAGREKHHQSDYKKSFFAHGKNPVFGELIKDLQTLIGIVVFSQKFIKKENRVNPTVGYRIGPWI
jgi:hypothetical protein